MDTHDGPLRIEVRVEEIRLEEARRYLDDPDSFSGLEDIVGEDARGALAALAWRGTLAGIVGGVILTWLRRPGVRSAVWSAGTAFVLAVVAITAAALTWQPRALAEPRYTGALTLAPRAIGNAREVVARFDEYRVQLASLVRNLSRLYEAAEDIDTFVPEPESIRLLHVSDIHLNPRAFHAIGAVVKQFKVAAVIDTGDINDWGTPFEAQFVERIGKLPVPYVFVRGNHDSRATQRAVAAEPNAIVLDGNTTTVAGVTIYGVGDPRFTPDKRGDDDNPGEAFFHLFARRVRRDLERTAPPVHVFAAHDPTVVRELRSLDAIPAPVMLTGHRHRTASQVLADGSVVLVEGSTGGAGLRAFDRREDSAVPLSMSVLYLDPITRRLQALDRIAIAGFGESGVTIKREVFAVPAASDQ
jgi:predicted phosphodiesterase